MRQNNHHKYKKFREQFRYFRYVNYEYEMKEGDLCIKYTFDLSGKYTFRPFLRLVSRNFYDVNGLLPFELDNLVFHIGLVELISYWKLSCPQRVIVEPHQLSQEQVNWWKKLYFNGLGEFFYLNGITPDREDFMKIESLGTKMQLISKPLSEENVIVPVGGGKDSVVTLELLKESSFRVHPMMLNPREASLRTAEIAGYSMSDAVVVERTLDPLMLELNKQGFLNGHTPFSALLAFVNAMTAVVSGTKYMALSNENSANESTVPGTNINHQYSKSFEFETDFMAYSRKYIHHDLHYFSFLRPLNELQIANLFSLLPQHFNSFRSCNVGSKKDAWCGKCPKCLFTRIILAPFVPEQKLQQIFHGELLDDLSLQPVFEELTGVVPVKPFECVGTPDEIRAALAITYDGVKPESLPVLLKDKELNAQTKEYFAELIHAYSAGHLLPAAFLKILLRNLHVQEKDYFSLFLRSKLGKAPNVLILGFGREGQSTYELLRKLDPEFQLTIADQNEMIRDLELVQNDRKAEFRLGKNYQDGMEAFDVIIKSPGVKIENADEGLNITSQTNLFLEFFRDQTIGITGTKGKSTTSSLIYHILKETGKKVLLLGNIGVPPFDLTESIDNETLVVFEMSAHQLENVHYSPQTAILLNIFPEHLDHFDSYEMYRNAKYNILKYQKPGDIAVLNEQVAIDTNSRQFLYGQKKGDHLAAYLQEEKLVIADEELYFNRVADKDALKGNHNQLNILAALLVVHQLGICYADAFEQVTSFKTLPHRLEYVGSSHGIRFYNDSISTVPESTLAAVEALGNVKSLILGGYNRGIDYAPMVEELNKSNIEHFIFLGEAGSVMRSIFERTGSAKDLRTVADIDEAVTYAVDYTGSGICLLSPAAASYDQFHNFEHRGDAFRLAVQKSKH